MSKEKLSIRFLRWFCPTNLVEEIEGDLIQRFDRDIKHYGKAKADMRLIWSVIRFFRPEILARRSPGITVSVFPVLFHNLRFSARHLVRNPLNSGIHIIGLTLGISTCLVIGLLLRFELRHDDYHDNVDQIYRVTAEFPNQDFSIYATPIPLADEIRRQTTGARHVALGLPQFNSTVWISPERIFKQPRMIIAEPEFIDIFKFEPVAGELRLTLTKPYTALLSESTAKKFFGDEDPLGKSFRFRSQFDITVGGVFKDLPANTNLPVSVILSFVDNEKYLNNGDTWYFGSIPWTKLQACTYVLLNDQQDAAGFQKQLDRIAEKNINSSPDIDKDVRGQLLLQRLASIHLQPSFRGGPWVSAINPSWIWFFGSIGAVVLALACINFFNLSTAQSITRAKEIAVRKVAGARKIQLVSQFLSETFLLVGVSWVISLLVVKVALPAINQLVGREISLAPLLSPQSIVFIAVSILGVCMVAGLYPAWLVARFEPATTLRTGGHKATGSSPVRRGLVVLQLGVSIVLMFIVVVITRQMDYVNQVDLGVEKDHVLSVDLPDRRKALALSSELLSVNGIKAVSFARTQPVSDDHWWNGVSSTSDSQTSAVCAIHADAKYFDVYGLKLISGSVPDQWQDTIHHVNRVVVNENLLKVLGLGSPVEAIGKRFQWAGDTEVAGVMTDFNTEPLRYAISPTLIVNDSSAYSMACIRLESTANVNQVTKEIEWLWRKSFPDEVFNLQFLDVQIMNFYQREEQFTNIFIVFAGIAIGISCLGLWGLTSFNTLHRKKEISIRKVLGATILNVMAMLSNQFVKLVIIASALAIPIGWYAVSQLLDFFAYKVQVSWWLFLIPVVSLLVLSLLTISTLTVRAALTNPSDNLRSE